MKESTPTRKKNCNCKRSRCLKLYCECFASGVYCDGCNCANCFNNVENEAARQEAVEATLERNPTAFRPKIGNSPQTIRDVREDACEIALTGKHNKGCHCKKSGCLKKYCECFQANIPCSDNCKCMDCKNFEGSEERRALFHGDHGNALTYMQQAENAALNRAIGSSIYASPTSKKRKNNDIFFGLSAKDQSIPRLAQCPQVGWTRTLNLAFQSIGVVYGDIGTSPLYVYSSTFDDDIKDRDDILGVLSLILYTLIIIPLIKYVFVVLWANDDGDGGTFALYSLISRHVKISLIPNQQAEDAMLSNYRLETPSRKLKRAQWIKQKLESSKVLQVGLFLITILATSMIIGDGILTPAISVLSAVSGIKEKATSLSQGQIALISIVILVLVFSVQRFGTDKVGYTFAPIIVLWFSLIGGIGIYNLVKYDFRVLRAFNPKYIVDYFKRNGKRAWSSLGGIVLCITGTEAMFADLSHFSVRAIQISFTAVLFPAVSLAYIGQASYLTKFPEQVADTFYKSIPDPLFWPSFIIAIAAAIIASQAMISGAFSIIQQSQGLSCFPRVKVVHTSTEYEGQVYIPEINYALMVASVLVTAIFRSTTHIGNAYGIAVVSVMLITTALVTLVMLLIWKTSIWWISLFVIVIGGIEAIYLSAVLSKFVKGGFLPLAFALFLMLIMGIWHYVHVKCYNFELENKVSSNYIQELACDRNVTRIPGIGLLYSELVQGIPPIFRHFVEKIPSIHSVFVFVSVKHLPVSKVDPHERFLFRQLEPREFRVFKCVVRYGYKDAIEVAKEFEKTLIKQLKEFIYHEFFIQDVGSSPLQNYPLAESATEATESDRQRAGLATIHADEMLKAQGSASHSSGSILPANNSNRSADSSGRRVGTQVPAIEEEKQFIEKEMEKGVVYLLGETEMVARSNSSIIKRVVVNNIYHFIRRNFRQGDEAMSIPKARLLKVGVTYEI